MLHIVCILSIVPKLGEIIELVPFSAMGKDVILVASDNNRDFYRCRKCFREGVRFVWDGTSI